MGKKRTLPTEMDLIAMGRIRIPSTGEILPVEGIADRLLEMHGQVVKTEVQKEKNKHEDEMAQIKAGKTVGPYIASRDYRSIRVIGDREYRFIRLQAIIIRELCIAWNRRVPAIGWDTLQFETKSKAASPLDIFKTGDGREFFRKYVKTTGRMVLELVFP